MAQFVSQFEPIAVIEKPIESIVDLISDIVIEWNTKYRYANSPFRNSTIRNERVYEANCQDFVDFVLHKLNIEIEGTALRMYIFRND